MSSSSRRFLIGVAGAILLAFVIAGVTIVAYNAGRDAGSAEAEAAKPVTVTIDDGTVTIEADEIDQNKGQASSPEEGVDDAQDSEDAPAADKTIESDTVSDEVEETPDAGSSADAPAESEAVEQADTGPRIPVELESADVDLLLEVWEIIDEEFDGHLPSEEEVTYSAIAGSLELLDDNFTRFITPDMAERVRLQLEGGFEGIGAFVDLNEDGYLIIVRPMQDQPAARAGLRADDVVTHVDGRSILGMSLTEMTAEIKGPKGTDVTLTIVRESVDEPFDVTVTRELIEIPVVSGELLEDNIAYVRLTGFNANAGQQLEDEIYKLLDEEPLGLILDLRDNPGGFLSQAVDVADLLLDQGVILFERDGRDLEKVFESGDGDVAEQVPLVILVNAGSASASEIVAGAVQDRGRGILIGETTFGKGSVQQPHTLSDGSELRVTIARWYTPNNQSISPDGIKPDIEVESPEEFGTENDWQLLRAIRYIVEGR